MGVLNCRAILVCIYVAFVCGNQVGSEGNHGGINHGGLIHKMQSMQDEIKSLKASVQVVSLHKLQEEVKGLKASDQVLSNYNKELIRFTKVPKPQTYVRKGYTIFLPCEVDFGSRLNYTRQWIYNGLIVKDRRYEVMLDGRLQIHFAQDVDNGRKLFCNIYSPAGNLSTSTTLLLFQLPWEPSAPRASDIQAHSMKLTWDEPLDGGSALTGYNLYMKNLTQEFSLLKILGPVTEFVVTNLLAGSKHKYRVSAMNRFGEGDLSGESRWIETKALVHGKVIGALKGIFPGYYGVTQTDVGLPMTILA